MWPKGRVQGGGWRPDPKAGGADHNNPPKGTPGSGVPPKRCEHNYTLLKTTKLIPSGRRLEFYCSKCLDFKTIEKN